MTNPQQITAIEYLGVQFSLDGVAQMVGVRKDVFVNKQDVHTIHLKFGVPGERRWLELALGIVFLGLAAIQGLDLLVWYFTGGTRYDLNFIVPVMLVSLGTWLVYDAMHKQWYLEVQTEKKARKLAFNKRPDEETLKAFLKQTVQLGYAVDYSQLL